MRRCSTKPSLAASIRSRTCSKPSSRRVQKAAVGEGAGEGVAEGEGDGVAEGEAVGVGVIAEGVGEAEG